MSCRICYREQNELFEIFGDQGRELQVGEILNKHFGFIKFAHNDPYTPQICKHCWASIHNWDLFFCEIEKVQNEHHPFEIQTINFLIPDKELIVEPTKYDMHEIKSESNENDCDFNFNGEDLAAIKAELTIKMSDVEDEDGYTDQDDERDQDNEPQTTDSEDDNDGTAKRKKLKSSRTKKSPKKDKSSKSAVSQEKLKAIADKCKRSNEWGDAQEENIKQLCKMECTICPLTKFEKWLDMKKHYRVVHQMQGFVICSCCDGKFTKRFKILDHVVRKLNPEEFKCKICNKYYENRDSLGHHMGYHQPEDSRPYKCEVEDCQKSFTRRSQFLDHQIRHTPESEKKFACNVCGKRFASESHLRFHMRRNHERVFNRVCEICGKDFRSNILYQKHKQIVHMNMPQPKAQCHICTSWVKRENLRKHIINLHGEFEDEERTCQICGKVAPNKKALGSHHRNVHVERTFECTICEKSFKRAINLREHLTTHSGEVLYTCPYCPKTFNSNANKHSHIKKIHTVLWEANKRAKMMENTS